MTYWRRLLLSLLVVTGFSAFAGQQKVTITTGTWAPYINGPNQLEGIGASVLRQLFSFENTDVVWQYQNYDVAFEQIKLGSQLASFPYFKTQERSRDVLFSQAVFSVTSHIYYNRQYNQPIAQTKLENFKIGRVAGYSYGSAIDVLVTSGQVFASEERALLALLNHDIDYLPMTESVMNTLLMKKFSQRKLLIHPLPKLSAKANMHLIAAKTPQGQAIIEQINELIEKFGHLSSLKLTPVALDIAPDIATLQPAEGYPVILGQSDLGESPAFYSLPQGTQVLVLSWSEKMLSPSKSDRLYKTMMESSKVVVLNGPHVGKELFIRNMYISL